MYIQLIANNPRVSIYFFSKSIQSTILWETMEMFRLKGMQLTLFHELFLAKRLKMRNSLC